MFNTAPKVNNCEAEDGKSTEKRTQDSVTSSASDRKETCHDESKGEHMQSKERDSIDQVEVKCDAMLLLLLQLNHQPASPHLL
jgi:hypothetical protein